MTYGAVLRSIAYGHHVMLIGRIEGESGWWGAWELDIPNEAVVRMSLGFIWVRPDDGRWELMKD